MVSWHMKAATMCEFSKQEFITGLQSLGWVLEKYLLAFIRLPFSCWYLQFVLMVFPRIDSLEKFRERIPFMRSELKDDRMLFCLLTGLENDLYISVLFMCLLQILFLIIILRALFYGTTCSLTLVKTVLRHKWFWFLRRFNIRTLYVPFCVTK